MTAKQRTRLAALVAELVELRDGEQQKYDNLPESLQAGAPGDRFDGIVESLDGAIDELRPLAE